MATKHEQRGDFREGNEARLPRLPTGRDLMQHHQTVVPNPMAMESAPSDFDGLDRGARSAMPQGQQQISDDPAPVS